MCPHGNYSFANDFMITHALGHMMCDMSTPCHKSPVTSFINNIYNIYIIHYIYLIYMYIYYTYKCSFNKRPHVKLLLFNQVNNIIKET